MTKVVIVDDEALIRSGFRLILSAVEGIDVVATCDGIQALDVIAEYQPDVVLLDIRMPGKDGLSILADLQKMPDPPKVAVLTTFDADDYIAAALRLGAAGFLLKDTDPEQLPHMVRSLAAGGLVLSDKVSPRVVTGYLEDRTDESALTMIEKLSDRETEVLTLLAQGRSNAEIAATIYSSVGTVKDQVSSILSKLSVKSRVEAAIIAQRAGLLENR
ncbi:response regulator [Mycolicibacterium fluoranthenivorans]|uniref:DNA-binding NarL/FixJ family response regulator n=1 Tax=Mycolicibacterium fluoranthenivorans TaxID=258505 RepID=A0A7X5ZD58_9MYCO|nr:response regulator transcription factor [Mycolicibacterium fluoranthenivorans]MCV7358123.1 response regulator transcription factor [Mycolicibacterium fluoranthenivorans]NIH95757.1 DNA-binding NarL/FixJ family response regulator [Mycolicibacterium fluoranthenivorans]